MSKISIIIPVHNTYEFLEECFKSISNQSYKDLEIIFLNDASTDNSLDLLKDFSKYDNRVKIINFTEKQSLPILRNHGMKVSTGSYIYFMDSDDVLDIDCLLNLYLNLSEEDITFGPVKRVHHTNNLSDHKLDTINDLENDNEYSQIGKEFNRVSCLNILIKKEHLIKNNIFFDENFIFYTDLFLTTKLINSGFNIKYCQNSFYFKRIRNDTISNPSLYQKNKTESINDFLNIYLLLKRNIFNLEQSNILLDKKFTKIYKKNILKHFILESKIKLLFDDLYNCFRFFNLDKTDDKLIKKHYKVIIKNNPDKYKNFLRFNLRIKKIKKVFKNRSNLNKQIYKTIFLKLPIKKNSIVFESFLGKNYSDSPKNIYEYLLENNIDKKYKMIWIFNDKKKKILGSPKIVKRFSLKYFYVMARADYIVTNSRIPTYIKKREGSTYLQTWHGTPLKKLVFDMKDIHSATPTYKADFYNQSRKWDYLISANKYSSDIFKRAFKFDNEIFEVGYPRNDILYNEDKSNFINKFKIDNNLPLDKKIILYAPTWRDNEFHEKGKYKFELKFNVDKLKKELGEEYIIILRMHYFISDNLDISGHENFLYDFSKYDDISHLYLISDLLITDYSSVMFDFANTKKPILFYTYDLELYRDTLRGFYLDFENKAPGPIIKDTDGLIHSISNINHIKFKYKTEYDEFYNTFCSWEDGNATEKIVNKVFK